MDELLAEMKSYAAPGPMLFPEDMVTDQPEKKICADIVREKLLALPGQGGAPRHGGGGHPLPPSGTARSSTVDVTILL